MTERERPALRPRSGPPACPYWREPLHDAGRVCGDCGVALHAACRAELGRCPAVGCAGSARRDARPERGGPRRHEAWRPAEEREPQSGRLDPNPSQVLVAAVGAVIAGFVVRFVVVVVTRGLAGLPEDDAETASLLAAFAVAVAAFFRLLRETRGPRGRP